VQRLLILLLALFLAACNPDTSTEPIDSTSEIFGAAPLVGTPRPVFQSEIGMATTRVITLEQIDTIPAGVRVRISTAVLVDNEWLYTIGMEASENYADARESQLAWAPGEIPGAPTPTVRFSSDTSSVYRFITTEAVGEIPANTLVRIQETRFENGGWVYVIVTQDERHTADARESQITIAGSGTPVSAFYNSDIGNGYRFITIEQVDTIAPNTRVAIVQTEMRSNQWVYIISTEDGRQAAALDWQLEYAPDVTPGYIPEMLFYSELGMGVTRVITLVNVGEIPANTRVSLSTASFDGMQWLYIISDGKTTAEARESELAYAPGELPNAPTPTAAFQDAGYRYLTTETVGIIPANTLVQLSTTWIQNNERMYGILTEDGRYAEARESQLTLSPSVTAGATPTAMFQGEVGMGVYRVITLEPIGGIPVGTRVSVSMAMFDGREWIYTIATHDGIYAEARGSQLAYALGETPGAPTPMGN
jgi:hypothetical protein